MRMVKFFKYIKKIHVKNEEIDFFSLQAPSALQEIV